MIPIVGKHGGYRKTLTFGYVCLIYHATEVFCRRNYSYRNDPFGKTAGQMLGSARSAQAKIHQIALFETRISHQKAVSAPLKPFDCDSLPLLERRESFSTHGEGDRFRGSRRHHGRRDADGLPGGFAESQGRVGRQDHSRIVQGRQNRLASGETNQLDLAFGHHDAGGGRSFPNGWKNGRRFSNGWKKLRGVFQPLENGGGAGGRRKTRKTKRENGGRRHSGAGGGREGGTLKDLINRFADIGRGGGGGVENRRRTQTARR